MSKLKIVDLEVSSFVTSAEIKGGAPTHLACASGTCDPPPTHLACLSYYHTTCLPPTHLACITHPQYC